MALMTITKEVEYDAKTLTANVNVRYWEDATIDGVEDKNGSLTPCRVGQCWNPIIDIDSGVITNWKQGTVADIHFKVCDEGRYRLSDAAGCVIKEIDGYVPSIMCPEGGGYGDYVIMKIDATGKIDKWEIDLAAFEGNPE